MLHIPTSASYNAVTDEMILSDYIDVSADDFIRKVLKPFFPGDLNSLDGRPPIRFVVEDSARQMS